jgi:hypothetical protein
MRSCAEVPPLQSVSQSQSASWRLARKRIWRRQIPLPSRHAATANGFAAGTLPEQPMRVCKSCARTVMLYARLAVGGPESIRNVAAAQYGRNLRRARSAGVRRHRASPSPNGIQSEAARRRSHSVRDVYRAHGHEGRSGHEAKRQDDSKFESGRITASARWSARNVTPTDPQISPKPHF